MRPLRFYAARAAGQADPLVHAVPSPVDPYMVRGAPLSERWTLRNPAVCGAVGGLARVWLIPAGPHGGAQHFRLDAKGVRLCRRCASLMRERADDTLDE